MQLKHRSRIIASILVSLLIISITGCGDRLINGSPSGKSSSNTDTFAVACSSFTAGSAADKKSITPFPQSSAAVPLQFQSVYNQLNQKLDALNSKAGGSENSFSGLVTANLLLANSNYMPQLMDSSSNLTMVDKDLDMFVQMGIDCVDVTIQYPLFVKGFPRADEYLSYYKKVFAAIRKRGLKTLVGVQATFTNPVFAKLPVGDWYKGLTLQRYMLEKTQMMQTVIDELQPDYLTLESEPNTEQANTGLSFSLANVKSYIDYYMTHLNRRNVQIGAGAGLWDDWSYWDYYLNRKDIDYVDIHIYPVNNPNTYTLLDKISTQTNTNGKYVVIGECWLYKSGVSDFSAGAGAESSYTAIYGRDMYSFWAPLDCKFINTVLNLGAKYNWRAINFFWSGYFYSYIDYANAPTDVGQRFVAQQTAASKSILSKSLSPTGEYLKQRTCY